jgi:hypothetical protein
MDTPAYRRVTHSWLQFTDMLLFTMFVVINILSNQQTNSMKQSPS